MNNGLEIFEPAKMRYYSEKDNINYHDLSEPHQNLIDPIFPRHPRYKSDTDMVRHFRKKLLWTKYTEVVDFFSYDSSTRKVSLLSHRNHDPRQRSTGFTEKFKYVLKNYATKDRIKKYMAKIQRAYAHTHLSFNQLYDKVYSLLKKRIKKDRR